MISVDEMLQAAEAARLEIPDHETSGFLTAINRMFAFVKESCANLDLGDVPPTAYIQPRMNVFRPDEPQGSLPLEIALANAPDEDERCFKVPRIMEEE